MIYNKRKINEDFDFDKIKKSNIEDEYKIDISFEHIENLLKDGKIDTTQFLKNLGREKCKEYLNKYLSYL
jgi:hypothetical protein